MARSAASYRTNRTRLMELRIPFEAWAKKPDTRYKPHVIRGKTYKPNGKRECARRAAKMGVSS